MVDIQEYSIQTHQRGGYPDVGKVNEQASFVPFTQDSDQESIETNDSNNENRLGLSKQYKQQPEIDVQPKRKIFFSVEQKVQYVEEYQKKYKTEVCKNWKIKGTCIYGDKCCFAHGEHELQTKTHLKPAYKTKPCKKFFMQGYCPYGYRCQYIHSDIKYYPQFYPYLENVYQFKNLPLSQINCSISETYQNILSKIQSNEEIPKNQQRLLPFQYLEEGIEQRF